MKIDLGIFPGEKMKLVRQTEMSECGLACVAMVASHWGVDLDMASLRRRFSISQRGATINTLIVVANKLGLSARPLKVPLEELQYVRFPAILHWDLNHYIVIQKLERGIATIFDPAASIKKLTLTELSDHFTGIALELSPVENFHQPEPSPRLRFSQLWRGVSGLKRTLLQIAVLTVVTQAFILLSPYFLQLAVDHVIPASDLPFLLILSLAFGIFAIIYAMSSFLRSFVFLSSGTLLSFVMASNVGRQLFRLPVAWFERRHVGDILSRFQSLQPIQDLLIKGSVVTALDGVLAIAILIVMFLYSALLASISLAAFLLYLLVRLVLFRFERRATETAIAMRAKEQSTLIESIDGIVPLRLSSKESARFSLWQNKLNDSLNADVSEERVRIWQETSNILILQLETIIVVAFAISFVLNEQFSVGMVFAYLAYKTQFLQSASKLVDKFIEFRMLGLHLERISDIALATRDISFDYPGNDENKLKGAIALNDVDFRFSDADPLVLNSVSLCVASGEHVAIKGPSGGGKSTLAKILLGLLEPTSGDVTVDGVPIRDFGYQQYHDSVAAVLQDDVLFSGSIAENIALFEPGADLDRIREAAKAAAISDDIEKMPMKYETFVTERGSNLSGGQRQRLLLARALFRNPRLLLLDEGTSSLDTWHERKINEAIRTLRITRIVIAHRQETIDQANRVFEMKDGSLTEIAPSPR
ncbi:ATP-binding cassette domain-containing protein [Erythrobacter vulgaris]|uniref:ATP-binding cassette domain-containing protein n=1 Tax=Qipengyuania vulgaris TaxID=291985 RepID=A0A844XRI2_9SPHN|nr:peptidase domain-containing ABC transporter [Qipengyuania vulgaris]MXO47632.1 ATP-binding cassette domain-containing protein [Qipengyuania vulgaris]